MNSVINGRIACESGFDSVYVPPAANDAGTSAGAAAYLAYHVLNEERPKPLDHAFLGAAYDNDAVEAALQRSGVPYRHVANPAQFASELIARGEIVGWFQGAAEFGPRALGNRSLLGDARNPAMRVRISETLKKRESFRPLAPAVLAEHYIEYFPQLPESPYMTYVGRVAPKYADEIPSAVHFDGTARPQTVDRTRCPLFHALISHFHAMTGVPVVLNTSFNVAGEPIVRTPTDAIRTLFASSLRHLVMGPYHVAKDGNPL